MRRSQSFYEAFLYHFKRGNYDLAAFSLEQALQLFLKVLLMKLGVGYPRTHSIRRLLRLIAEASPQSRSFVRNVIEKYSVELALLEDAYITFRYTPRGFEEGEVLRLKIVVDEVVEGLGGFAGGRGEEEEKGVSWPRREPGADS